MNSLSLWLSLLFCFLVGFACASLTAGATYWIWGSRSAFVQTMAALFAVLVIFAFGELFLLACIEEPKYAFIALATVLTFSVGQAFFERAADSQRRAWGYHHGRTFICYLCSAALSVWFFVGLIGYASFLFRQGSDAMLIGCGVGFFFAPLSISFFRWMLPSLRLRPGKDRPLEAGDVTQEDETFKRHP